VQVEGVPVQDQPGSTRQVLEQPSPPATPSSSQASPAVRIPSPHRGTQSLPGLGQRNPGSTDKQSPEQPSSGSSLPSSQISSPDNMPSPQSTELTQGRPGTGQA
jgi:hypothetical protein